MPEYDYDMVVIGSGPGGQRAAIQAAKLDKRVAIVERKDVIGGVCLNIGTIPSKTLREAVLYLSGYRERGIYGESYTVKQDIKMQDLLLRTDHVMRNEIEVARHQLMRNRVELIEAEASFADPNSIRFSHSDGTGHRVVTAANVVVATGTSATEAEHIPFDSRRVFTADHILEIDSLPRTLTIVGAGVIGLEYASIFATLGIQVTLVEMSPRMLPFVDSELVETLTYQLRQRRVTIRLGEEVSDIEPIEDERGERVRIHLGSGKQIVTEKTMYSIGRSGATERLNPNPPKDGLGDSP